MLENDEKQRTRVLKRSSLTRRVLYKYTQLLYTISKTSLSSLRCSVSIPSSGLPLFARPSTRFLPRIFSWIGYGFWFSMSPAGSLPCIVWVLALCHASFWLYCWLSRILHALWDILDSTTNSASNPLFVWRTCRLCVAACVLQFQSR